MKCCSWSLTALGRILFVLVVLVGPSPATAWAQKKDKEDGANDASAGILKRLRKECEDDSELRGVLILAGKDRGDPRKLIIEGAVDRPAQIPVLTKKSADLLATFRNWAEHYPGGVNFDGMKISSIRSKLLPQLRIDFARGIVDDKLEPKEAETRRRLLAQTRLDDLFYRATATGMELTFEGACIFPDADKDAGPARKQLVEALTRLLEGDYKPFEFKQTPVSVAQIAIVDPVPALQKKLTDAGLNEVLLQDAVYRPDGTLQFKGWIHKANVERVNKLLVENPFFAEHPGLASANKKARYTLDALKVIDWPIDRKKWNLALAQDTDPEVKKVHIQRIFFANPNQPQLQCEIVPFAESADGGALKKKLISWLMEAWSKDWPATHDLYKDSIAVKIVANGWEVKKDLQNALTNELGAKQALVSKVVYDEDDVLAVDGIVGSEEQRKAVAKYLQTSTWTRTSAGRANLDGLCVEDWPAKVRDFQKAVVTEREGQFKQIILDDPSFLFADGKLELRFAGITLDKQLAPEQKKILREILAEKIKSWPTLHDQVGDNFSVEITPLPPPDLDLHDKIEADPALDGVILDVTPTFNSEGKLVLAGKWRGPKQEADLKRLIDAHFAKKPLRPNLRGIVFDQMEIVPTDRMLDELKKWVAKTKKEDIFPDRISFDRTGSLHIHLGNKIAQEKTIDALKDELRRLIKLLPEKQRTLKVAAEVSSTQPRIQFVGLSEEFEIGAGPVRTLAKHLREKIVTSADARWDGVLIERCYYNVDGKYIIEGLVDDPKQIDLLESNLKQLADSFQWGTSVEKGWQIKLRSMPIQPMLKALRAVMPEYPELDRFRLGDRVHHDENKKLVLTGFSTWAEKDKEAAAETLATLLLAHPQWKERIEGWLHDPEVDTKTREARKPEVGLKTSHVEADPKAATLATSRALALLTENLPGFVDDPGQTGTALKTMVDCLPIIVGKAAEAQGKHADPKKMPSQVVLAKCIDYLDVALFNTPEDTAAWYLRAACQLAAGNEAVALRDLRRMSELEAKDVNLQKERLIAVEAFQGSHRQRTAALAERAMLQIAGGHRIPSLAEIAQVSAK